MSQPINRYKADLRELNFVLFEQFGLGEYLGKGPFAEWGEDEVRMTLNEAYRFSTEVTGPLNGVGDAEYPGGHQCAEQRTIRHRCRPPVDRRRERIIPSSTPAVYTVCDPY